VAPFFAFVVISIASTLFITTGGKFVHLKMRFFCQYIKMLPFADGHYLDPYDVFSTSVSGLPAGTYTFYFAVDTNMDGNITPDSLYYDSVKVIVH